jgi:hypothetical protein
MAKWIIRETPSYAYPRGRYWLAPNFGLTTRKEKAHRFATRVAAAQCMEQGGSDANDTIVEVKRRRRTT